MSRTFCCILDHSLQTLCPEAQVGKYCGRLENKTQCAVHRNCNQTKYSHIMTEVWEQEGLGWTLSTSFKWPFSWHDQQNPLSLSREKVWHWQLLNQEQETQTHHVVFFTLTDLPLPWSTAAHYKSIFSPVFRRVIPSLICGVDFF